MPFTPNLKTILETKIMITCSPKRWVREAEEGHIITRPHNNEFVDLA